MKVLFLSAEAVPYIKVGGLGDVAGALPQALRALGCEVRFMMPRYGLLDVKKLGLKKVRDNFNVNMDWRNETCQLWRNPENGDSFIENQYFFGSRFQVYGCGDEVEQFVLFCRAALEACRLEGWQPDVIHAHDWHTAAAVRLAWAAPQRPGLVFTIHNLAHQGNQRPDGWPLLGVYDGQGPLNLMQQAIYCADYVTTVSPNYAREICSGEYGCGLDGLLRERGNRLVGILNGLDTHSYAPRTDTAIAANYDDDNLKGKVKCKKALLKHFNLPVDDDPLIGLVGRLDWQKGVSLLLSGIHDIIHHSNAKVIILGSGDHGLEQQVRDACERYPDRVACFIGFNAKLARVVYAGSDIFLMPSLFEPCGLSQLIAMRYGTLPVARATGGLYDTITDCRSDNSRGTGFLFSRFDYHEMLGTLGEALVMYNDWPQEWRKAMRRGMQQDFTWHQAALSYLGLYESAAKK